MKNEDKCCKDMTSLSVSLSICNLKKLGIELLKACVRIYNWQLGASLEEMKNGWVVSPSI